jgi:hypothetical protein
MASGKNKRKAARQARKQKSPRTGPFRHPDGDRRHRGSMTYEQVMAIKRKLHEAESSAISSEEEQK